MNASGSDGLRIVIADTGPVNYLLLIGSIDILPALFGGLVLPSAVRDELVDPRTPLIVREWIDHLPAWVDIQGTDEALSGLSLSHERLRELPMDLGAGETSTLVLATALRADLVLMDDRQAVAAAQKMGIAVTGTMGLLARAAARGMIHLPDAFERLKRTNFRYRQETMDQFLRDTPARKFS